MFWDPTLVAGNSVGNWSTKGCRLAEDKGVGQAKICHCDHLTSFAILIVSISKYVLCVPELVQFLVAHGAS